MKQNKAIGIIKKIFYQHYGKENCRMIKLHGGRYQEGGLPDIMMLVRTHGEPGKTQFHEEFQFWIEVKRDWDDEPTALQKHNVKDLSRFGFITGYCIGDDFKYDWEDKEVWQLADLLKKRY